MSLENIKPLPSCIDSEKGLICGVMIENTLLNKYHPSSDVFFNKDHKLIWKAIKELGKDRQPIDVVTIKDKLGDKIDIDYIYELATFLLSTSGVEGYYNILIEKWKQREIIKLGQKIHNKGYDGVDITNDVKNITQVIASYDGETHNYEDQITSALEYIIDDTPVNFMSTGYKDLDNIIGGFEGGQLIIVAGRASMGKTAFMLNLANNIADDKQVGFVSLEVGSRDLLHRLMSLLSLVPFGKIKYRKTTPEENVRIGDATERLRKKKFVFYDNMKKNYEDIEAMIRQQVLEGKLDVLFIDYLQLLELKGRNNNRVQEVSTISRGLKLLALELDIPIIAGSQLSRGVENRIDKEPILADLRESGSIEQDADSVLMLYREDYYDPESDRKGEADVFVRKNRNGRLAKCVLRWIGEIMGFISMS